MTDPDPYWPEGASIAAAAVLLLMFWAALIVLELSSGTPYD